MLGRIGQLEDERDRDVRRVVEDGSRHDDAGLWNLMKTGYLFVLHLSGCILLLVATVLGFLAYIVARGITLVLVVYSFWLLPPGAYLVPDREREGQG